MKEIKEKSISIEELQKCKDLVILELNHISKISVKRILMKRIRLLHILNSSLADLISDKLYEEYKSKNNINPLK